MILLKDNCLENQNGSSCSQAIICQFGCLLSTEGIAPCLVSGGAHPVLAVFVDGPEAYRVARVCHVALAQTRLFVTWDDTHVALDEKAVVVGKPLALVG